MPGQQLHPLVRAVIIAYKIDGKGDVEIAQRLGIFSSAVKSLWHRTTERAETDVDIFELLSHCDAATRAGAPPKIANGSVRSAEIRDLLVNNPYLSFVEVGEKYNWNLPRSTIENIAYRHTCARYPGPLSRKIQQNKCYLDAICMKDRLFFCHWGLKELDRGVIFIFTDESYLNFGGVFTPQCILSDRANTLFTPFRTRTKNDELQYHLA